MRRPLIAAAVLGVALVVAGCGGDDSSEDAGDSTTADGATTTESTSGTREEFIEMADAICAANDGALGIRGDNPTGDLMTGHVGHRELVAERHQPARGLYVAEADPAGEDLQQRVAGDQLGLR